MASSNLTSPASSIPGEILSTWLLKSWNNKTWVSQAKIASGASCRSLTENINKKTERIVEATESEGKKGTIGPAKLLHCNIHSYRSALHESCCQWKPTVRFLPYPLSGLCLIRYSRQWLHGSEESWSRRLAITEYQTGQENSTYDGFILTNNATPALTPHYQD